MGSSLFAQHAAIQGLVTEASGTAVPLASIKITNLAAATRSNESGL